MDEIAQRYSSHDGQPLVDYLPALIPCQLLTVDVLAVERRELPSPVEFVLKTCDVGLDTSQEIAAFLGFSERFMDILIEQMKSDEMVVIGIDGRISLLRRGKEALQQNGDCVHIDKTIFVMWDPITETPILSRQELVSERVKRGHELKVRFPAILRTPSTDELDVKTIQAYRRAVRELDITDDRESILRFVRVRRTLHKYRHAAFLIYENGKSAPVVKLAIDGQIDEKLSSSFALKDGGLHVGADQRFYRRAGALAVENRLRELNIATASGESHEDLSRRRAVLNWRITTIAPRLAEDDATENVRGQFAQYVQELEDVESELATIPVRHMGAAEFPLCLKEALLNAKHELIVTTTIPNESRFSVDFEDAMNKALQRRVRIKIYIADRIDDSQISGKDSPKSPIARLNALVVKYPFLLEVRFLQTVARPVFEIFWDNTYLVFANDSPLGYRSEPSIPRAFRGIRVSNHETAERYAATHLNFQEGDFVKKSGLSRQSTNRRNTPSRGLTKGAKKPKVTVRKS